MKKVTRGLWKTVQWGIAVCLGLVSLGAFTDSFGSGICCLASTLFVCPLSRNGLVGLLTKSGSHKRGRRLNKNSAQIYNWLFGFLAVIFLGIGSGGVSGETEDPKPETAVTAEKIEIKETIDTAEAFSETGLEETETAVNLSEAPTEEEPPVSDMEVHFIDVGQGDATLVKADGHYMLIDAGDNSKGSAVQLYLSKQGVKKLDYLILTHTDADHIGGGDVIVSKFDVDRIFLGDYKKDNKTYKELMDAMAYRDINFEVPEVGAEYQLGNASFTIIAPNAVYEDPNNSSIAFVLKNGENTFLFSGDCEADAEADILSNGIDIDVDVYKAGHHGSKTSSSKEFLEAMTPVYSVISCEENNSYGFPHAETLNNLRSMGVKVFRTDEQGSIIAYSDGSKITWNCAPSESWKAGENTQHAVTESSSSNTVVVESTSGSSSGSSERASESVPDEGGRYAVNAGNGKIHIVGGCAATGNGKNAMKDPVYFSTYEDAEAYSAQIAPDQDKRKCGNCWK